MELFVLCNYIILTERIIWRINIEVAISNGINKNGAIVVIGDEFIKIDK